MSQIWKEFAARAQESLNDSEVDLPGHRFFTPKPLFFQTLKTWHRNHILAECGCGTGELVSEMWDDGIRCFGIDINRRAGQLLNRVLLIDALEHPWTDIQTCLVCRPDHQGWAGELAEKVLEAGGTFIYVGFEYNLNRDLQPILGNDQDLDVDHVAYVGAEGEGMWLFQN